MPASHSRHAVTSSGGRFRLGIGQGYRAEEFDGFGVPRGESLKHVNFPGDVEVVNTITETGVRH